jgi:hypothetical protein
MPLPTRTKDEWTALWKHFEELGVAGVKAQMRDPDVPDFDKFCAQMWLDETEDKRHQRALDAAEDSARLSRTAAIASAVAAIAAAVSAAWPWIATVWGLPGAPK